MDANRAFTTVAICIAVAAVSLSCYAIVDDDASQKKDVAEANFTDKQIVELVEKLKNKGGKIYTAQGNFDLTNRNWTIDIGDKMLVCHFSTYNQDYYIPFSSIDYIWTY